MPGTPGGGPENNSIRTQCSNCGRYYNKKAPRCPFCKHNPDRDDDSGGNIDGVDAPLRLLSGTGGRGVLV